MVQCREKSSHDCRSDRLTVSTVAATVTVTAAVTVPVTAAVTATAMNTQIYKNDRGRSHLPPPRQGGELVPSGLMLCRTKPRSEELWRPGQAR